MSDRFNLIVGDDIDINEDYVYEDDEADLVEDEDEGIDDDMEIINEDEYENEGGEEDEGDEENKDEENENTKTNRKRSWVWDYFSYDNNLKKARCNLCKTLIASNKGSTTGMSNHMKSRHKITKNSGKEIQNQLTLEQSFKISNQTVPYSEDNFRKLLVRYIVMGDHSFLSIESDDFRNMLLILRKDITIPSADTIKNDIMKTYNESFKKIRRILRNISNKISFTLDIWTSSNFISFVGITAHWISNDWEIKNILLDFVKLEGSHSGKNLKEVVFKSLKNFGVINKVNSITTDNASNNITFLRELSLELAMNDIEFDADHQHVRCLAHIINLAAQEALKSLKAVSNISDNEFLDEGRNNNRQLEGVSGLLYKLRVLICKIRASTQQRDKFLAQCNVSNIKNKMVILDVKTRWNSTFDMLVRARELKEPLNVLSNSDTNLRPFAIHDNEWKCLENIENLLKGFSKITKQICGELYPTLGYVLPYYNILLDKLEDYDMAEQTSEVKEAANKAKQKLCTYYSKTDASVYSIAMVLDPRLKLEYMNDSNWEQYWIDNTKKQVVEIYNTKYAPKEIENHDAEYDSSDEDLISHITKKNTEPLSELDKYFKTDRAPALCNILDWWKRHEKEFPNLSNMAKDYLGIPATSAPAERIFSSASDVVTSDRACLSSETIRAIMCLKHWYRSGILD